MKESKKKITYHTVLGIIAIGYLCLMLIASLLVLQRYSVRLAMGSLYFILYAPFVPVWGATLIFGKYFIYSIFLAVMIVVLVLAIYINKNFRYPVYVVLIVDFLLNLVIGHYIGALIGICFMVITAFALRKWGWNAVYTEGMRL